ncbi:MAG TPA: hydrogenase [Thermoanaerobaculia bacterium]|nr:hydrogenase [Thermoanaerobaculia bacterium]
MNRRQIQLGFVLILIALGTGFFQPFYRSPRLGLAAHTVGITGGLVLIAIGALADKFALGTRAAKVMMACWLYTAYVNWLASIIAAITGASRLTPIAGAGTTASPFAENVVAFLLQSLAVTSIVGTAIAVFGFRRKRAAAVTAPVTEPV